MIDQVNKEYQATPAATLEQQIMNPNFPKNEREWWAADRIEQLESALRDLLRLVEEDPEEDDPSPYLFDQVCDRARAALAEEKKDDR